MLDWKPLYRDIGFYYITLLYMASHLARPGLPSPQDPS